MIADLAEATLTEESASALYGIALTEYVRTRSEGALYQASLLSYRFVEQGFGPEDIIAIHAGALEQAAEGLSFREQAHASTDAVQFLLDVMIAYGVNHRAFLELRMREQERIGEENVTRERSRTEEAQRAATERADLMRLVSHEIRTPLAVIKGSLDLTRRALARGHMDQLDRLATQAQDAVSRLTRMTNDLFEASRGTASAPTLVPVNLRVAVAQAFSWAIASNEKELDLGCENDGKPLFVLGDTDSLASVLGNLITNAMRYTPQGGRVAVRCSLSGSNAVVVVTDNGIGMTPETALRVFDKFYRAPEALALEPRGLGLGLALTQQLVQAHGGTISVDSTVGAGSAFTVVLPATEARLAADTHESLGSARPALADSANRHATGADAPES